MRQETKEFLDRILFSKVTKNKVDVDIYLDDPIKYGEEGALLVDFGTANFVIDGCINTVCEDTEIPYGFRPYGLYTGIKLNVKLEVLNNNIVKLQINEDPTNSIIGRDKIGVYYAEVADISDEYKTSLLKELVNVGDIYKMIGNINLKLNKIQKDIQ